MSHNWIGKQNKKYDLGFYRVSIQKDKNMKHGFRFKYKTDTELLKVNITSKSLLGLKEKVVSNNLYWGILDREKALKTCIKYNVIPTLLNSNVNSKYVKNEFTFVDYVEYKKQSGGKL